MICVRDILQISSLGHVEVISSDAAWLDRGVHEVAVMDSEPLTGEFDIFYAGDAVFSSLGFSGGDMARIDEGIMQLLTRDVACVLVKDALPWNPSDEVIAASKRRQIPIFRYKGGLLEQIITDTRNLIALEAEQDLWEERLTQLIALPVGADAKAYLRETVGLEGAWVQAALFSLDERDPLIFGALKNHIQTAFAKDSQCLVVRFGEHVVVIAAMDEPRELLDRNHALQLMSGFGAHPHTGISEVLVAEDCPTALQEALAACRVARETNSIIVEWTKLHTEAFVAARQQSPLMARACEAGLVRLRAFDEETGSNLAESMRVYVACGGDINATAEKLFQHPNSVRNRILRVRSVLSLESATDKELFAYLSMIYL